jgi:CrcB protein
MTPLVFLALALAGGAGAMSRFALDGVIRARVAGSAPWGTITINLSGSLVLGLLTGVAAAGLLPDEWLAIAGTGFLGGYTTFSTASVETVRILQERRWGAGIVVALGTLVAAIALAGLGLWIGMLFR